MFYYFRRGGVTGSGLTFGTKVYCSFFEAAGQILQPNILIKTGCCVERDSRRYGISCLVAFIRQSEHLYYTLPRGRNKFGKGSPTNFRNGPLQYIREFNLTTKRGGEWADLRVPVCRCSPPFWNIGVHYRCYYHCAFRAGTNCHHESQRPSPNCLYSPCLYLTHAMQWRWYVCSII